MRTPCPVCDLALVTEKLKDATIAYCPQGHVAGPAETVEDWVELMLRLYGWSFGATDEVVASKEVA